MIALDSLAPDFRCTAIVNGAQRQLNWRRLHDGKILVLFFDSLHSGTDWREQVAALNRCADQLARLHVKIALVCRDDLYDILVWLEQLADEDDIEELPLSILVDSDNQIASMFDVSTGDGRILNGRVLIDTRGFIRDVAVSAASLEMDVPYILHYIESIHSSLECAEHRPAESGLAKVAWLFLREHPDEKAL